MCYTNCDIMARFILFDTSHLHNVEPNDTIDRDIIRAFLTYGTSTDQTVLQAAGSIYGSDYDVDARPREVKTYILPHVPRHP